ncbi:MAG: MATE family efflux transporter, partial [Lachnospiraceae bacterium]|nr:MATE family efflux transporter [Lachnospiraceae bacterium]
MREKRSLTEGSVGQNLIWFALPYLLSCFMQTFYGMADLFVVGLYNGSQTTTAVSIGSQVIHMLTVIIVGFAMGATVRIGRSVGAGDQKAAAGAVGTG